MFCATHLEDSMAKSRDEHRAGGKYAGSHSTIFSAAAKVMDATHNHSAVKKIVIDRIKSSVKGAGSPFRVKCLPLRGNGVGYEVAFSKGGVNQRCYVYVTDEGALNELKELIEGFSDKKAGKRGKKARKPRKSGHFSAATWYDTMPEGDHSDY